MSNLHTFQGLRRMRRAPFNPIPTTLLGYRMTSFGQTKQQNHLTLGKIVVKIPTSIITNEI